jgi:ATP-dependent DNA helicase RecG
MVELTAKAGLVPPEFESRHGEVVVRFRPTQYIAPTKISHELSPLQQQLLEIVANLGQASLRQIIDSLPDPVSRRTIQDNMQLLRKLDVVDLIGAKRGARWTLKGAHHLPVSQELTSQA